MAYPQLGDPPPLVGEDDVQQPQAADPGALAEEWRGWMAEPGNRQAIMQFGINLMQPVAYGQSAAGHFGQAVGAAGEAVDRFQTAEYREREQVRKEADTAQKGEIGMYRAQSYERGIEAQRERARAATIRAESNVELAKVRAEKLQRESQMLDIQIQREPDLARKRQLEQAKIIADTEAQRALAEHRQKQTELSDVRVGIEQQRADTGDRRVDLIQEQGGRRLDQGDQRMQLQREQLEETRLKRTTMTPKQFEDAYRDHTLFGGKMSREEFDAATKSRGGAAAPPAAGGAKPTTGAPASGGPQPNPAQIKRLMANPSEAAIFDQKFGPGAAKRYLGE